MQSALTAGRRVVSALRKPVLAAGRDLDFRRSREAIDDDAADRTKADDANAHAAPFLL